MTDITYRVHLDENGALRRIDMAKDKFTWLAADTFTRSKAGAGNSHLEQGKAYEAAGYDPLVVSEWVRAGAAKWADEKKAGKEKDA